MGADAAAPDSFSSEHAPPEVSSRAGRIILVVIGVVFVVFQVTIVMLFYQGGDSMKWKRELALVDERFAEGKFPEALTGLEQFGERWPDARTTFGWNEKMGRYAAATGDWTKAARFFGVAVGLRPKEPKINAQAGEAYFRAGDFEKARKFLQAELETISRATGDHDRSNVFLGLIASKEGRYLPAMKHFQAVGDQDKWKAEIATFRDDLEKRFVLPAREAAKAGTLPELP